ncbi:DEHYDRATION-INDUCED 19 homolog 7-like protein [Drosera capensis]
MERGDHHWSHRASKTASSNSSFRRFQSSKSEVYLGGEDGEIEECKQEFLCPFCGEEFDVVGLFCHIEEEHPVEVKNGVCPVCAKRVGMDMEELRDVNLQSLLEGSSHLQFSSNLDLDMDRNPDPDPLLSSFISSSPSAEGCGRVPAEEASSPVETKAQNAAESYLKYLTKKY